MARQKQVVRNPAADRRSTRRTAGETYTPPLPTTIILARVTLCPPQVRLPPIVRTPYAPADAAGQPSTSHPDERGAMN